MRGADGKPAVGQRVWISSFTGKMTRQEIAGYLDKYRKELFTADEEALQKRGGGPGGWVHYHGSAKFHAQAGKAFAEAMMGSGNN